MDGLTQLNQIKLSDKNTHSARLDGFLVLAHLLRAGTQNTHGRVC